MKLNRLIAALGCAAMLMFSSCGEDYLYKSPQGSVSKDVLATPLGVDMLVTTAYETLTRSGWGATPFNWTMGSMYGGDANKGSDPLDQSILNEMEIYLVTASNSYLNEKWDWVYRGNKRVEMALQLIEDVPDLDASVKATRQGELYFLRALFYFEGVKVFGPFMPYIDETNTENDPKIPNDVDIYPNILSDIDKAIANLPDRPDQLGRTYAWAAKALKAKILMQQGNWQQAMPILADVVNNGSTASGLKYALADDMTNNWDAAWDNKSPESIFEVQFSNDGNNNGNVGMSICYPHNGGPGGCCGFFQPSFELVNSFQVDDNGLPFLNNEYRTRPSVTTLTGEAPPNISVNSTTIAVDPRLDFAVGRVGIPYKDYGPAAGVWVRDVNNGGCFMPKKHVYYARDEGNIGRGGMSDGWAPGSALNIQYLSVRDIVLLYAECLANDGNTSAAMEQVNKVRRRAALPVNIIMLDGAPAANYKVSEYPASHAAFSDRETCIKAVRMERKLELAMEGQRWFDLVRYGGDYMSQATGDYMKYEAQFIDKFNNRVPLAANKTMFPVPSTQINDMGNDENGNPYLKQAAPFQ
ncbi:MAG: RagB/SusD family nutrient uptake outer membrane protein [Tannerella sp.]|jgi:hypothetical protein|nr:RagB/SusD family nutrient uptake outer membrane protein [Tannerella sp.]